MDDNTLTANDIMKTDVVAIGPSSTLAQALDVLADHRFSGLPVVNEKGLVVGVLSKTDIIAGVLKDAEQSPSEMVAGMVYRFLRGKVDPAQLDEVHVSEVMTRNVHVAKVDTPVRDVAELMIRYEINRVPVVDEDKKLMGIITRSDLLTVLSQL